MALRPRMDITILHTHSQTICQQRARGYPANHSLWRHHLCPGRAGTIQEVFQEAVQNHYLTFGFSSPMIFLDTSFWTKTMPFYPLLVELMNKGLYKNLRLTLTDETEDVVNTITTFQTENKMK